ncbi:glycosyl transferase [Burkholderia sp. HI2761]|uniref:GH36-type glycosyl hydrolase domain-containing protein n=1 Tax=unclassified Burkholderia TaxID=2613784 RepID=UPI000B7AB288|nr:MULTISPECIES: glucoamylase family protein [unclassified Burkholderia]MPV57866.1 glycosyl transferase [Burkholderia sp. BE24]OXJ24948.1 glycosyl transferase [Burkholderia sp. HI2761]
MKTLLHFAARLRPHSPPWTDTAPVRDELFGIERLEQHAQSLAAAQPVTDQPPVVLSLHTRLDDNAAVLLAAYRASARELERGHSVVPAAEWLLDNYHLVEEQIREIRDDLPPGYYRLLPKLSSGPFAGYPRVFGLAWAFVAHTDSHFNPQILRRFIDAYQRVQPLTIGELWAVAITLRIVLIENLRRLADQITAGRIARADADALTERLLESGSARSALEADISTRSSGLLSELFAAQLAKRLRDQDPRTTPALGWLEERLRQQGSSVEEVVLHAQQRQGASNVTVRNVITSMRMISDISWTDLFESVSLVDERLRAGSAFSAMDFPTRNLYRSAIEQLARGSAFTELEITGLALHLAHTTAGPATDSAHEERTADPGYHLIAEGRRALEDAIGFRPPTGLRLTRFNIRLGIIGYVGEVMAVAAMLLALALWAVSALAPQWHDPWVFVLFAVCGFLPATEIAVALVNRTVTWSFGANPLPALELTAGVPSSLRTLIAVPMLLTSEADTRELVERLEVHHLAGAGGDLSFALLADGLDADQETLDGDAPLVAVAAAAIEALNHRYGPGPGGDRFLLLVRRRVFNAGENCWMGWERKRGKLHELNRLLRGATDTTFVPIAGYTPHVPPDVRYVITLDADTRLPRDAALRLIGKMAHPLNRPRFSSVEQRVVGGYAILQPRVTPSLPVGQEGSLHQRVFSGPSGMDPYAAAVSDVYQDLFGEGSFTGKGIYDIDAFEAALQGRVPENALLSHDLFEGVFARAGLASDVEVVEEAPARYDVVAKRQHRWTRGDWQLLPWIVGHRRRDRQAIPLIGRLKMLDNLRRSLIAPLVVAGLALCWLMPLPAGIAGVAWMLCVLAIPAFLPTMFAILQRRTGVRLRSRLRTLGGDARLAALQTLLSAAFLVDHAWRMGDAIVRTLMRLFVTHRHLLEWTTAAQSKGAPRLTLSGFYRQMAGSIALTLALSAGAIAFAPSHLPLVLPIALLWLAAPAFALWSSRSPATAQRLAASEQDARYLRLIARRTWRFFETFVTPEEHMLPPDNYQEDPKPVVAHRTSPTNLGLYLLSAVAARDFGWAGTMQTVERLEAAFASMQKMTRFKGHFYNWYGTQDLQALAPAYVSSVDSGNLAGHLITLANACEEWLPPPLAPVARSGMLDNLHLARAALDALRVSNGERGKKLLGILEEMDTQLRGPQTLDALSPVFARLTKKALDATRDIMPAAGDDGYSDLMFWIEALTKNVAEHARDQMEYAADPQSLQTRLISLAETSRAMALGMDFSFLLDPERKLLSIGYSHVDNSLDPSCYDLLASEARLASLFAIAKGDVATTHWFRLGRAATPVGTGSALISWSGSMFEYLMPSLVMRAPVGSLLEQTSTLIVERQRSYGRELGIPWGISESAYNARDMEFTYQYSNFGVPGLGLKRGLSENRVIAPYATGLAAMVAPEAACENYARLAALGALGRYGFYEALDFTRARLPDGEPFAIVRNFMAHHQGMTIVAIANTLLDAQMRARFHREPMIQASELLLQERMPRDVAVAHPRAEEVNKSATDAGTAPLTVRRVVEQTSAVRAPITHLLSNGRYAVMLTATGAGYSRWRDLAITRWREDTTRDNWGSFIFLRDTLRGHVWSAGAQPLTGEVEAGSVVFGEDHAEFTRRDGSLTTTMNVLVSGEDDGEVRRVSLANSGRGAREIELTSYAELSLATPAADNAHPAFSRMFVQTEHLAEFGALVATRRLRSPDDPQIWAAHFAVVDGEIAAEPQYETDRLRFLGRGHSVGNAASIVDGEPLGNTTGTVLDPVFALRYRVLVPPGKVVRVTFWTVVADSRARLLDLIDKHHDRNAFDRAKTLAWTQAQVQLRYLDIEAEEAADFQRLAAPILYADPRFRAPSEAITRGAGVQSGLWPQAISGDLPIVLLRISDVEDIAQVRQLLKAHEYWRMKRLAVDLVIVNERASSYIQELQTAIETAVRSSQTRPRFGEELAQGAVYTLRADLISVDTRALLQSIARVALTARRGSIATQFARMPQAQDETPALRRQSRPMLSPWPNPLDAPATPLPMTAGLEFFNGLGGFDKNGCEYVTVLTAGAATPAPWINVIANSGFGFQVAAEGTGYTWAENSRENQLTPWSNDPVEDPAGEVLYVRDEMTGDIWGATALPIRDSGTYIARHGHGYSHFEHEAYGVALGLLQYVPLADPLKISRLTLRNTSGIARRLSVTAWMEWVLGTSRGASGPFVVTEIDPVTGAMFAHNPWNMAFGTRVAFADLGGRQTAWTADRTEFLGRHGAADAPLGLTGDAPLSGATGAGLDPCAALQGCIELGVDETVEVVAFVGQCASVDEARALIQRYRSTNLDAVLADVTHHWQNVLGAIQVKTPDRAMDLMLNGWLLYQTLACRIEARSAFYQASGAYGFRDQLQDGMALTHVQPDETRRHLLRAASRQFVEGDFQHWWLPHSGQGVRTRISDDRVWLAFAAATYIGCSGDAAVLDEIVPFLDGPLLRPGEHDAFFQPMIADEAASLFEHCARGLDQCIELTGAHGLPLIGTGDWNDGMNRVGAQGSGESVWLGWLLLRTVELFAPLAEPRDAQRVARWRAHAATVRIALERDAWDGEWYRRATFDDGTWLGSHANDECRIDSIAQSWAVLSGAADPARAALAMVSLEKHLIRRDDGIALLFTPPFDSTSRDPGYIKGYPPGLRENGGQYSHAAMWAILAYVKLGDGNRAAELFALLNPVNHARTPVEVDRYKVEPYVVAADVYSVAPHVGHGGWTWYTGSAGWMYRAGVEGILGIRREGDYLVVNPCIPDAWPGFTATVDMHSTRYEIRVESLARGDAMRAVLDGEPVDCNGEGVRVPLDAGSHTLSLDLSVSATALSES